MEDPFRDIGQIFFNDGYLLASNFTGDSPGLEEMLLLSQSLYKAIDSLIEALVERAGLENQPVHCARGCHWCCSQAVFINPLEAVFMEHHIRRSFKEEEILSITKKVESKQAVTASFNLMKKLQHRSPCPLLENKVCSIYHARPVSCRIYLSMDLSSCIELYRQPEDSTIFAKLFEFPLRAGRMMNEGIAALFREKGLQMNEITFESGLLTLLHGPDTKEEWLLGKNVFPDVTNDEEELKILNDHRHNYGKSQQ